MNRKLLLNQDFILSELKSSRITIIDGGARGNIFTPFDKIDKSILQVIKFEPDADAGVSREGEDIIVRKGLWNETKTIKFNLFKIRSVSSVHPPNQRIMKQLINSEETIQERQIEKTVDVDVVTVDELFAKKEIPAVDFIKLDIHGSEVEAVEGAITNLQNHTLGILAETWTMPFYLGQKTHSAFEVVMNENDFYLFEQLPTGSPKRNIRESHFHKYQALKFDCLFFKDIIGKDVKNWNKSKALKYVGIADLFFHFGYALQLNEYFHSSGIYDDSIYRKIKTFIARKKDFKTKYFQKIIAKLQRSICAYYD